MCGVIGLVPAGRSVSAAKRNARERITEELIGGLGLLLYRGYDSVGVARAWSDGRVLVAKMPARGPDPHLALARKMARAEADGPPCLALGHSRWATHGAATEVNAHPHVDCRGRITVVHNGIVENTAALKDFLARRGSCRGENHYISETDTEIIAHLIGHWRRTGLDLRAAVTAALKMIHGSLALLVIDQKTPATLVVAKRGSTLLLGVREIDGKREIDGTCETGGAHMASGVRESEGVHRKNDLSSAPDHDLAVASSPEPLAKYGYQKIRALLDDEVVVIRPGGYPHSVSFYEVTGTPLPSPKLDILRTKAGSLDKGRNDTFLIKEIKEQPTAVATVVKSHYVDQKWEARLGGFDNWRQAALKKVRRIFLVAEGSSLHAAEIGADWLRTYAGLDATAHLASEYAMALPPFDPAGTFFIVISQSGETADTRVAAEEIIRAGGKVFGLINVIGSSIARLVGQKGGGMYTHAGPEISVASTKVYTAQLSALAVLTLFFARNIRGIMGRAEAEIWIKEHRRLPLLITKTLELWPAANRWAAAIAAADRGVLFVGRGPHWTTAREGALKLRELSYLNAVAYSAGEMKHGTIALIDKEFPTVAVTPRDKYYEKTLANLHEIKARGGPIYAIVSAGDKKIKKLTTHVIEIPQCHPAFSSLLTVVPLQMLAYYTAKNKGRRIDRPRNLAKSVTVA